MSSINWELTAYEQSRKPHETLPGNTEIAVSPCNLHSELQCPICLDILTNTMTTKECLHRFCSECITTALRNGNKECPTCRKKLVSHRSLRKDTTFDAIVSKIFPDRSVYEEQVEKRIAKLMQMNAGDRYSGDGNKTSDNTEASDVATRAQIEDGTLPSVVELQMKLHDKSTVNDNDAAFFKAKYFSTSTNASVDHLVEFLIIKKKQYDALQADSADTVSTECQYDLSIFLPEQNTSDGSSSSNGAIGHPLNGQITLAQLMSKHSSKSRDEPLELLYLAKPK